MSDVYEQMRRAEIIVAEECEKAAEPIWDAICARIEKECPAVEVVQPPARRGTAYASRSGPKPINAMRVDVTVMQATMVFPICDLEVKKK